MKLQLVSVIIPCYKNASTLARSIESVISQTYPYIEIIVVNDCSPETEQIETCVSQYPQIRYFCNPSNIGVSASRNVGIGLANGFFLAFLDADDEYHPDKISTQIKYIRQNTVVTCGLMYVYPDGYKANARRTFRHFESIGSLLFRNTLNGAGLLIAKDLLLQHGGYDVSLRSCEDFDLWIRLLTAGVRVIDIGQPLYFYYFNPQGLSKDLKNISKWEIEVIRRHATRMPAQWQYSYHYAAIASIWLLRQFLRGELSRDSELRRIAVDNTTLMVDFPWIQRSLRLLSNLRLFFFPALCMRILLKRKFKHLR